MAVINLGTASRRPSSLSGLSDAMARGLEGRERKRSNRANEKIREDSLSSAMASQGLRKREQDISNVRKTHNQFSMWWNGMDAQEKAIAKTSEQYKEMQKFFKSFKSLVPGLVADNGDIVAADSKDVFKNKFK